jgi:hypothetical protein
MISSYPENTAGNLAANDIVRSLYSLQFPHSSLISNGRRHSLNKDVARLFVHLFPKW